VALQPAHIVLSAGASAFSMQAVEKACRALAYVASSFELVCNCDQLKSLEKLLKWGEDVMSASSKRVDLNLLGLQELEGRLGEKPPWLDAVAAAAAGVYICDSRIDAEALALALCAWVVRKRREDPHNPVWLIIERTDLDREYSLDEWAEAAGNRMLLRRLWRRARLGDRAHGAKLVAVALLHLLE